jgi:hypothetical protein
MSLEDRALGDVTAAAKWALLALLAFWTLRFVPHPLDNDRIVGSFLGHINLPFHEAGHILFSPFGPFMTSLGGSLLQVLVPVVCVVAFVRRHDVFAALVCAWWAGQNLVDMGPYIADARALRLVLLGGKTGAEVEGHDWEAILGTLGWLHKDRRLGMAAHVTGSVVMIASVVAAAVVIRRGAHKRHEEAIHHEDHEV